MLGTAYGIVLTTQILLLILGTSHADWELPDMTRPQSSSTYVVPAGFGAAALLIALLVVDPFRRFAMRHRAGLAGLLLLTTAIDLRSVTIGVWANPFLKLSTQRQILDIEDKNLESFQTRRSQLPFQQYTTLSLSSEFNVSVLPDWHLERYVGFLEWSDSQAQAREARTTSTPPGYRVRCRRGHPEG